MGRWVFYRRSNIFYKFSEINRRSTLKVVKLLNKKLEALERSYVFFSSKSEAFLIRKFVELHLNNKQESENHISALLAMLDNLSLTGFELTDRQKIAFLTESLGESFFFFCFCIHLV